MSEEWRYPIQGSALRELVEERDALKTDCERYRSAWDLLRRRSGPGFQFKMDQVLRDLNTPKNEKLVALTLVPVEVFGTNDCCEHPPDESCPSKGVRIERCCLGVVRL